jgi:soluble lytic murein transglycosylase
VALGLAWNRDDDALAFFDRVAPPDFDDSSYEWRARAALWARDWTAVAKDIAAMPASMRDDPCWRYWAARASAENGEPDLARRLYSTVVPTDNWYAVLAAARLGQPFAPHPQPIALDAARVDALADRPAFRRAHELLLLGWLPMARSEWNAGYDALDAPGRQAAVGLADRWGWYFQSIATAARLGQFDDYSLLYPTPFDDVVNGAARLTHLPTVLIYAVMRQESLYQPQAVSGAGAVGLMQLMPSTARSVAAQLNRRRPNRSRLMLPEVNVPLGAGRLAELLDRLGGQVLVALAAYNAGPNAARRWLPEHPLDADIWVENIPYNETRAYVQRVMWHSVVFSWLHDRKAEGARSWLAQVKPVG